MWRAVPGCEYYVRLGDCGELSVTDFVNIWSCSLEPGDSRLQELLQNSNPNLEMDSDELVKKAIHILEMPECITESSFKAAHSDILVMRVTSRIHGYPLHIGLELNMGSAQFFFQRVTNPILKTVLDLKSSERQLCTMLVNKDKEINEYKAEGGQLFLKYLKTPPFNHTRHMDNHAMYATVFGADTDMVNNVLEVIKKKEEKPPKNEQHDSGTKLTIKKVTEEQNTATANSAETGTSSVKEEIKLELPTHQRTTPKKPKKRLLNL